MVQLPGKRNRLMPILITPDVKAAMDVLVELRGHADIPTSNPYFFASNSPSGYIDHRRALKNVADVAHVVHPELITSTGLRKYISTVAQVYLFCSDI